MRAVIIDSAADKDPDEDLDMDQKVDGHGFREDARNNAFASAVRFALKRMNRMHPGLGEWPGRMPFFATRSFDFREYVARKWAHARSSVSTRCASSSTA